ncbi:MAG: hypothetical protein IPI97_11785 [Nitrosomonas sp.]|nr:hypothetical protein [Nitrosomonas sp.]
MHNHITDSIVSDATKLDALIHLLWKQQPAEVWWHIGSLTLPFLHVVNFWGRVLHYYVI